MKSKKVKLVSVVIIIILAIVGAFLVTNRTDAPALKPINQSVKPANTNQSKPQSLSFNRTQYSLTDPTSIWVIANKQHSLQPKDYVPADLVIPDVPLRVPGNESMQVRQVTATALESLFAAASKDSLHLMLSSGYRSYQYQVGLYGSYVKTEGQATADTQSARPGFSEHQTGLAADVEPANKTCEVETCFSDTPEGQWLAANAYKYGFVIRYPSDKIETTGYEFEPWHIRYVGADLSNEMHRTSFETLEDFFNVKGGTTYTAGS